MAEVNAFKDLRSIQKIKDYLYKKENKRDYVIFVVGINVGLRASDLLALKAKDVYSSNGKDIHREIALVEKKTSKKRVIRLNDASVDALNVLCDEYKFEPEDCLFKSRKGNGPISVRSLNRLVKLWCRENEIKGNFGSHSLRKTFGYHTYMNHIENPRILHILQKLFGHSSELTTLRYIGIENEEIKELYDDLNL